MASSFQEVEMERLDMRISRLCGTLHGRAAAKLAQVRGQGTTEYAILVGVLVVIAIIAITLFRPKIQELWTAIAEGINGL
jgi:Flp pilus assembly pilin Flp